MKLQKQLKNSKSLTTVQSKQNSKSSSRIEEYSNIGNNSKLYNNSIRDSQKI